MSSERTYRLRDLTTTSEADWRARQANPAYVQVAKTHLDNGHWVSTIWVGIDDGSGLVFETVVFVDAELREVEVARHATEAEARAGHARLVEKWIGKEQ